MKITYLLGAGASAEVLPVTEGLPSRMSFLLNKISDAKYALSKTETYQDISGSKYDLQQKFIKEFQWLITESFKYSSVDTFAKKIFLTKQRDLNKATLLLSAYFILEQTVRPDKRYDAFLASILEDTIHDFPKHLKIISWNYDYQFEKAYAEYSGLKDLEGNQRMLNVISKYTYNHAREDHFAIYKLNGTTTLFKDAGFRHFPFSANINSEFTKELLDEVIENYSMTSNPTFNLRPALSFAWENYENKEHNIVEKTIKGTSDTEVLVVIGYSFPFFNREIDRRIIGSMGNLKKVYIQAPNADEVKESILSVREIDPKFIIPKYGINQFYIPSEF
jgi:hypothetical protein